MSHVFEVVIQAIQAGIILNNIYHVLDGNESESPDDVADVFEDNYIPDVKSFQVNDVVYESITVTPMDVSNPADPVVRIVNLPGDIGLESLPTGNHIWVKLVSDDNGFKSGGKMLAGFSEADNDDGIVLVATINSLQIIFDDLLTDLVAAGLALCIYRPTLSTPGFPQVSTSSAIVVRGFGSNNRRQRIFQR